MPRITLRLTDAEHAALKAEAARLGLTVVDAIRARCGFSTESRVGAPAGNRNNPYGRHGKRP